MQVRNQFVFRRRENSRNVIGTLRSTREEAEQDRLDWLKSRTTPEPAKAKSKQPEQTLNDFADHCMKGRLGTRWAPNTFATNETIRLTHLLPSALGQTQLSKISHSAVQRFADSITLTKATKEGIIVTRQPSPAYRRRIIAYVAKILSEAVREQLITSNPATALDLPKVEDRINRTLSPSEAIPLMNPERRIDAIMALAMLTGMNRSELIALQWQHIDFRQKIVHVPGTKNQYRKRPVPLVEEAITAIQSQPRRSLFVFSTESGKPLNPRNVSRDYSIRKEQLGLPKETRLQDLRGSYVSLLLESGATIREVMELAGHNNERTTLKAYSRARQPRKAELAERLAQSIRDSQKSS